LALHQQGGDIARFLFQQELQPVERFVELVGLGRPDGQGLQDAATGRVVGVQKPFQVRPQARQLTALGQLQGTLQGGFRTRTARQIAVDVEVFLRFVQEAGPPGRLGGKEANLGVTGAQLQQDHQVVARRVKVVMSQRLVRRATMQTDFAIAVELPTTHGQRRRQ